MSIYGVRWKIIAAIIIESISFTMKISDLWVVRCICIFTGGPALFFILVLENFVIVFLFLDGDVHICLRFLCVVCPHPGEQAYDGCLKKKITRELLVKKKMKITFIAVVEMNNYISCGQYCNTPNTIMQLANANSHATQPHNALFHSYMVLLYLIYYMLSHAHIIHYH